MNQNKQKTIGVRQSQWSKLVPKSSLLTTTTTTTTCSTRSRIIRPFSGPLCSPEYVSFRRPLPPLFSPGVEMNGIQNKKARDLEKPFPGCLGGVVNLFDLNTGMAGNGLLTDKPHGDGSPLTRSRPDMAGMSQFKDQMDDKVIVSELKRNSSSKKSNGTPMRMLIAQEMSKELVLKHNPPSVVAKLMGLDALPRKEFDSAAQRSHSNKYLQSYSRVIPSSYWQQDHEYLGTQMHEIHGYSAANEYKDVYEIWPQSQKTNYVRDKSPRKGRYSESTNEKKMALVREKFVEAKRLATDENLRQSKQFQDALEVLSSNKDLLVKFLQEPNSFLPQHKYDLPSTPRPPETKRITVLRPSKVVDNNKLAASVKGDKQIMKPCQMEQVNGWEKNCSVFSAAGSWRTNDHPSQPTRIVVLKPGPGKLHDIKDFISPPSSSPIVLQKEEFYGQPEDEEARPSREVARDIMQHMRDNLSGHRRDETLLSSVFSNGYIGDESSFNKSENEYSGGNLSDLEIMSPASRHSWDYVNRFGSPYSSSFSHASYSPESSVCREAKKRLSERWAMMANNGGSQEHRHGERSSSTLGEMLALSDTKKPIRSEEEEGSNTGQVPGGLTSCLHSDLNKDGGVNDSPRNLLRSKSLPISSTVHGNRLNVEVSDDVVVKADKPKDLTKSRGTKSSFKGKVSSLFFSRNKKSSKEKFGVSPNEFLSADVNAQSPKKTDDDKSHYIDDIGFGGCVSSNLHGFVNSSSSPEMVNRQPKRGMISQETGLSIMKPTVSGISGENQEHPSPISVLEQPFEEYDRVAVESSGNSKPDKHGIELPLHAFRSNLIDKSPPIGSIARTLSWEDSCASTATSDPVKPTLTSQGAEEERQEWFFFLESLLSRAGLRGGTQIDSILQRWHSPESPLDPSLRDIYVDVNDKETLHEAKKRQWRSTNKLMFDCVNAALVDMAGYGSGECQRTIPCSVVHSRFPECKSSNMVDLVWAQMKDWFSGEVRFVGGDSGDSNSLVVDTVVRNEVVGRGWEEQLGLEMDSLGMEIGRKLLEELVQEAVVDLTGIE